jgi:hypothetical protein
VCDAAHQWTFSQSVPRDRVSGNPPCDLTGSPPSSTDGRFGQAFQSSANTTVIMPVSINTTAKSGFSLTMWLSPSSKVVDPFIVPCHRAFLSLFPLLFRFFSPLLPLFSIVLLIRFCAFSPFVSLSLSLFLLFSSLALGWWRCRHVTA